MQNTICLVEFIDSRDNIVYGVKFTGVMTRQYIYAKRTSQQSAFDDPLYIRVKVSDTHPESGNWYSHWPAEIRRISVHDSVGLHDKRFERDPKISRGIRKAIDRVIQAGH